MRVYSIQERVDFNNARVFRKLLIASEGIRSDRNQPNKDVFEKLFRSFRESGTIDYFRPKRRNELTGNNKNEFMM